jgi:hypothetical protein
MPCCIAVFLRTTALIQQWPGLVLRASASRYPTVIRPSTLAGWAGFDVHLAARINAFSPFMWPSPLSAMPRLKRHFTSIVLPFVNFHGRVNVLWVTSSALARPDRRFDALQRPRRMFPRVALVHPAKRHTRRESKPPALDHPSSLQRPTTVALIKVADFCISLVLRITLVVRLQGVRVLRSSYGRL